MISEAQKIMVEKLAAYLAANDIDLSLSLVEMPQASFAENLRWLQEESEAEEEWD